MTNAVTSAGIAFIAGIGIGRNAHATADAIGYVARLAGPRTGLIAAHAVDTAVRGALRIHHAGLTIRQLTSPDAIACTGITFIAGILTKQNRTARTVGPLALGRPGTRFTRAIARRIAAIPVDTETARAIGGNEAGFAVDALAIPKTIALTGIAFIVRIGVGGNVRAGSYGAGIRARDARPQARRIATNAVDAISAHALVRGRTGRTVWLLALTKAVTCAGVAFIERVVVGRNGRTRADTARDVAGFASIVADRVATDTVDALTALTLRAVGAGIAVGFLDLTRRRIAEISRIAFAVGYARRLAGSGDAGVTRLARLIEFLHANALTVTRIGRVFRRCIGARCGIADRTERELGAAARTGTNACVSARFRCRHLALVVRIGVAGNGPAIAVDTRALLRRRTRLAFPRAARAATDAIDTIARVAFGVDRACRTFRLLHARLARRLAQLGNAIIVGETRFADDALHRTNFTAIGVRLGAVFQSVVAGGGLALILEAIAADAIDADDASFTVGAFLSTTATAIEIRFVAADFSVVRAAEETIVDDQVAVVVDAVALLGQETGFGVGDALRRSRAAQRTLDLALITRRSRVFRTETRLADARNAVIDTAVAIIIETVAKLDTRERLSGADTPHAVGTGALTHLANADVQFLRRPGKTCFRRVVDANARAARNPDVVNHAVAIVVHLAVATVGALGDHFTQARAKLAAHTGSLTGFAGTNALRPRRPGITSLGFSRSAFARRIRQADVVDEAVAIIILGVANIRRRSHRAQTWTVLLRAAAGHRSALAFPLQVERTFDLLPRFIEITRFHFAGRALTHASGSPDIVDDAVAIVIESIARIQRRRQLLSDAFTPYPIFTNLLAGFTRTFAQRIRRTTITLELFAVVTGQTFVNRAVAIVVPPVSDFLLGCHVTITLPPRALITTLKSIPAKTIASSPRRTRVTTLEIIRRTRAGVDVVFVDQTVAIIVDTVATGIGVRCFRHRRTIDHRQSVPRARRNQLLTCAETTFQRRQFGAI